MLINRKYLFLLANFIMFAATIMSETDLFWGGVTIKIKYLYILYCLIDIIQYRKNNCGSNLIIAEVKSLFPL